MAVDGPMSEELETVLRLVADGTLTPEQASPIIEALTRAERESAPETFMGRSSAAWRARIEASNGRRIDSRMRTPAHRNRGAVRRGRQLRIRVTEHGRQVVNLRIPIGFVDAALKFVPGIGEDQSRTHP